LGAVRSEKVKRVAWELFRKYPDKFTADFEKNKQLVMSLMNVPSKRLRNTIVGYVTRIAIMSHSEKNPETEAS
jgi:small subunit ribosomal protein S17e